jgi:hypothetical protein
MTGKPPSGPPAPTPPEREPGRLGVDDRGNKTWEWANDQELLADDILGTTSRLRALVDPSLQIRDDEDDPLNPAQSNPKGLKTGYNPYNSGALEKQNWKRTRNLRELSKWIELRRKTAEKKGDE